MFTPVANGIYLSGNIADFSFSAAEETLVRLEVYSSGTYIEIFSESITPIDGLITVSLKKLINRQLEVSIPNGDDTKIQTGSFRVFRYTIAENTPIAFFIAKGGIDHPATGVSDDAFMESNFLSWQPQIKNIRSSQPEYLSYLFRDGNKLVVKAYYEETSSLVTLYTHTGDNQVVSVNVSYSRIASLYAKEVKYYDVYVLNSLDAKKTYTQRYLPIPRGDKEQTYLFENTLGGVDTLVCAGELSFKPSGSAEIAVVDEQDQEINFSGKIHFIQNTGYIQNEGYAKWIVDFFLSKQRLHLAGSTLRSIIIPEQEQEWHYLNPSGFEFEFYYSDKGEYNFVDRTQDLPELSGVPDPSSLFFLTKRLADYPFGSAADNLLIAVQSAFGNTWLKFSLNDLLANTSEIIGNTLQDLIDDEQIHKHINLPLLQLLTYINGYLKVNGQKILAGFADEADHANTADTARALQTQDFAPGITTGQGGRITANGDAELESLILRRFLEVPELRYNRISIQVGNKWNAPGGGIILSVTPDQDLEGNILNTGIITLKLEDGEIGTIAVDDICQGIFHDHTVLANNAPEDADDSLGNFSFAGFYTCYFRVSEIIESGRNSQFRYVLRPASESWPHTAHPCAAMHFVGYGNFTDADRQTSRYSTRSYERYLKDVNAWEFSQNNIAAQFGDLSNLSAFDMDMSGYSAYLNNIYMSGVIKQFQEIPVRLEIDTQGDSFLAWGEAIPVTCRVMKAFDDVTEHVASWAIARDTGDPVADTAWLLKAKVQNFAGTIEIAHKSTDNDLGVSEYNISTLFTITATMDDGFMAQFYLTF